MANTTPSAAQSGRVFESLAAKPDLVRKILVGANLAAYLIPIILLVSFKGWDRSPQFAVVATSALAIALSVASLVYSFPSPRRVLSDADRLRILTLTATALIGLTAAAIGLALPIFTERFRAIFAGGLDEWRKYPGVLLLCGGLLVGGLAAMFVGLQLARQFERTHAEMRRLLYGYNAFLAALFLFAILALVNVLSYARVQPFSWFSKARDWTSSKIYSLTPESETFLASLKEPVTVYVMIPGNERELLDSVTTLLDNCNAVTDKIKTEFVSRDRDEKILRELQRKFVFKEAAGILVVVGSGGGDLSDFIKLEDLQEDVSSQESERVNFKGEGVLMKSIDYLTSGKAKGKVYFTQGNDELDVKTMRPSGRGDDGLGELWLRLGQGNYEFKDLDFSKTDKVPADADIVVVANPRRKLSPKAVDALEAYMEKPNGKLIVLMGAQIENGKMARNGLEPMLRKYQVVVNDDRVLRLEPPNPLVLTVVTNRNSENPVARAFWYGAQGVPFQFTECRSVGQTTNVPGGRYSVEDFVVAHPSQGIWAETDLKINPDVRADALLAGLRADDDKAIETISRKPITVGVAVSAPREGGHAGPHGFTSPQQPKLLVFGDASWIANSQLNGPRGQANLQLFSSCLSWLRERPDVGIINVKNSERTRYNLSKLPQDEYSKLFFQPIALMLLVVFGLGGAVWVARRR